MLIYESIFSSTVSKFQRGLHDLITIYIDTIVLEITLTQNITFHSNLPLILTNNELCYLGGKCKGTGLLEWPGSGA